MFKLFRPKHIKEMEKAAGKMQAEIMGEMGTIAKDAMGSLKADREFAKQIGESMKSTMGKQIAETFTAQMKSLRPKNWFQRHKILTGLGAVGGAGALYSMFGRRPEAYDPASFESLGATPEQLGQMAATQDFAAQIEVAQMMQPQSPVMSHEQMMAAQQHMPGMVANDSQQPTNYVGASGARYAGMMDPAAAMEYQQNAGANLSYN